jgi:hypothetical protein
VPAAAQGSRETQAVDTMFWEIITLYIPPTLEGWVYRQ